MSDMLKDVALAIYREDLNQPEAKRIPGILRNYNERMADKAIAAAEPHLRRKHRQELLDELIAKARERWDDQPILWNMSLDMYVDWLMEQRKEAE